MKKLTKHTIYAAISLIAMLFVTFCSTGCFNKNAHNENNNTHLLSYQNKSNPIPDLQKPDLTPLFCGNTETDATDQLYFIQQLSRTAGGTWIVITNHPLDLINTEAHSDHTSVQSALLGLKASHTPVNWDISRGYLLLVFGSNNELEKVKAQPPKRTIGLYMRANTDNEMLNAFADFEHIKIDADQNLLSQKALLRASHVTQSTDNDDQFDTVDSNSLTMNRLQIEHPEAPDIILTGKLELPDIMHRLGEYYSGQVYNTNDVWTIKPITDSTMISAEIARLNTAIRNVMADSTHNDIIDEQFQSTTPQERLDELAESKISIPLDIKQRNNIDSLALLGKPAIPTLVSYLDISKPQYTLTAIEALSAMNDTASAMQALRDFAKSLITARYDKRYRAVKAYVLIKISNILNQHAPKSGNDFLRNLASDQSIPDSLKIQARYMLINEGDISTFNNSPIQFNPTDLYQFSFKTPSESSEYHYFGRMDNYALMLNQTIDINGDEWAVFKSGKAGNVNDLWLAHGHNGKWNEYLFTNAQFVSIPTQWNGSEISQNACSITINGDIVRLLPPKQNPSYNNGVKTNTGYTFNYNNDKSLSQTYTFSLNALRKDSDNDGLTDLLEYRLGTNPQSTDTDNDGVRDLQDSNPITVKNNNDDNVMLQTIFTALYGGSTSTVPIYVILEKQYWQEFIGTPARVFCITKDDYIHKITQVMSYRFLQFIEIKNNDSALNASGPFLFNENHNRAEIHFLCSNGQTRHIYDDPAGLNNYIAIFDKINGKWILRTIHPFRTESLHGALTQYLQTADILLD